MINILQLFQYLSLWAFFGIIHSLTARPEIKNKIPLPDRGYRVLYNIVSILTLLVVLQFIPSITSVMFNLTDLEISQYLYILPLLIISATITALGLLSWNIPAFIGLASDDDTLQTTGIFAFSRHPVYSGIILFFITLTLVEVNITTLTWLLGAGGYFVIGTIFEERNLSIYFDTYDDYQSKVGRFFPFRPEHISYLFHNLK